MLKKRMLVLAAGLLVLPLGFASNARATDGKCEGKRSPLDSTMCTYCTWGAPCGVCTIKGCTTQVDQGLDGG